jgi:cytochrome P450
VADQTRQQQVDFHDPEFLKCPYPLLKQIRETTPVVFHEPLNLYLVSGYEAARTVLLDTARFSNELAIPGRSSSEAERVVREGGYGRHRRSLQNADEPLHTVHRKLVNDAFRPKRIRQMADYVNGIVAELIDAIDAEGDVVHHFAIPLPLIVIADQLGVPRDMYRTFKSWSDAWLAGLGAKISEDEMIAAAHQVVDMQTFFAARIDERREHPEEDILSDLAHAEIDGAPVPTGTIIGIVEQLLVAGNETTTNGIAAGLHLLATRPGLHQRLRQEPGLVTEFAEEILRTEAPVQALFRRVAQDTELDGVALPAGSVLLVHYGAASRDESKFSGGDEFDLDRPKKGAHLAFGSGIHHCVGSELARVEMRASFAAFTQRFGRLEMLDDDVTYHPTFALRGIQSLRLRLLK